MQRNRKNNRMPMTRDLFKKIRDTKGIFHAKMGPIKDRNGMDLTEAEDIKKRWQAYTEELYKKDVHNPGNHNGVITHLEPDILECEVKWALQSITMNKASGVPESIPSDQCKEIEENKMGKTRDLFKKIKDTKGTPHAKMGSIKDRKGMDLTEAEDIKKKWQEYTEGLHKKRSS